MRSLFNKIMVACDFSELDAKIIRCTNNLIRIAGATEVHFVHVVSDQISSLFPKEQLKSTSNFNYEKMHSQLSELVERCVDVSDIQFFVHILNGEVYKELRNFSNQYGIDLIIAGQKKCETQVRKTISGLTRNINANILLVTDDSRMSTIKSILVPVDFSAHSAEALKLAILLKYLFDQPVVVKGLHVAEMNSSKLGVGFDDEHVYQSSVLSIAERSFSAFLLDYQINEEDLMQIIVADDKQPVSTRIIKDIAATDSQLVIMGTKGYHATRLERIGSTAAAFIKKNNKVPLLMVR